jgi:hypothetical protein
MDANGLTGGIEMYLRRAALIGEDGKLRPVRWTGQNQKLRRYQGAIETQRRSPGLPSSQSLRTQHRGGKARIDPEAVRALASAGAISSDNYKNPVLFPLSQATIFATGSIPFSPPCHPHISKLN